MDNRVIVEIKSVERLAPVHSKQLLTYLKLTNTPVGLPASASPRLRVNQGTGL